MAEELQCLTAAAVLRFLQQHDLEKTAKALLREASKRGWDLEDADAREKKFNLLKLCAAEERRRSQLAQDSDSELAIKKSKRAKAAGADEQPQPRKKCRSMHQQETPEAKALCKSDETSAAVGTQKKKGRKQAPLDEIETAEQQEPDASERLVAKKANENNGMKRFQRVDDSQWTSALPPELKDNSFWKKKNDNFAIKAAEQLGRVRGRDFRHEKTKKKKATWKGCGEIPLTVNSIQFASDSD